MPMSDKQQLHRKIMVCSFTLTDVMLYLDSHPDCQDALDYYHKHKQMLEQSVKEYEDTYGPLTAMGVNDKNNWTWVTTAFPWEVGES